MLKWYLGIYICIEYLKCVWKSNCIRIIQNNSKKKRRTASLGPGSASRLGRVWWNGPSHSLFLSAHFTHQCIQLCLNYSHPIKL